ncbi:cold-regulated plasma membrane protein [Salix suchowensis]|nr:cold-regulated plasma membrane protein [Salix suchowensis]
MGKNSYLAMRRDREMESSLLASDFQDLTIAAKKLANHAIKLGGLGFGTAFLEWIAAFALSADLDRTNWKTNILTGLLIPYIFFTLPSILFNLLRGDVGKWIAFVGVILRLFFPNVSQVRNCLPHWLEMPGALILLIVVAPSLFASTVRNDWIGVAICLAIASHGISNTVGIILLFVYPAWALLIDLL